MKNKGYRIFPSSSIPFQDWDFPNNWKHNKKIKVKIIGDAEVSTVLSIYKNKNYSNADTSTFSITGIWGPIYSYSGYLIDDATILISSTSEDNTEKKKKFNYESVMLEFGNISGALGAEIMGADLKPAVIGDK